MSIRFTIQNTPTKATKESDGTIIRYSGIAEPFRRTSSRLAEKKAEDANGRPIFRFTTGLDENRVDFYPWYNSEEKKEIKKQIKELTPVISAFYGGDKVLADDNQYFWAKDRTVAQITVTNETNEMFFDTKNPNHALLYLSLIAGAYEDTIAPTYDWAQDKQRQHYVALSTDVIFEEEDEITRSDAHGALAHLRKDAGNESLFILAWCLQIDTNGFGGFFRNTAPKEIINSHIKFIDGKLVTKKKRNTPAQFIEYAEKWDAQQTRASLYIEAYVKAGEYYSFINQREKKYVTADGTVLGNTVVEAVASLQKPKFQQDLEKLRDQVEAKWKE